MKKLSEVRRDAFHNLEVFLLEQVKLKQMTAEQTKLEEIKAEQQKKHFPRFKSLYLEDYHHGKFFTNPSSEMKKTLESNEFVRLDIIEKYAQCNPNSRTARIWHKLKGENLKLEDQFPVDTISPYL